MQAITDVQNPDAHAPVAAPHPVVERGRMRDRDGPKGEVVTQMPGAVATAATSYSSRERDYHIVAVIPAYRAANTIQRVVTAALQVVDAAVVVDDCCPENSGALIESNERVHVVRRERNGGVGAAVKTGIAHAVQLGARYVVKIDADDQMDVRFVPDMVDILDRHPDVDLVKGNRFGDPATLQKMPAVRLIGNAGLTLLIKFSSGYWTIVDPTNGFVALRVSAIQHMNFRALADQYFFEADLICALGLRRRTIAELEMPAIYADEQSSLSIPRALVTFPPKLLARFVRRLIVNYLVVELNVGSLCGLIGVPMLLFAIAFGGHEWLLSNASGIGRPTGTIVLALLLFMTGFQLTLQALLYDVQFATRTLKFRPTSAR